MKVIKLDKFPSQEMIRELACVLESDEQCVEFSLYDWYFSIIVRSDGDYEISIFESLKDLLDEDVDSDDGGICSGCSVNAIEMFLPEKQSDGNGGKNSFYDISKAKDLDDLVDLWSMDFFNGNILKTLTVDVGIRHNGTSDLREAKKAFHYAERRLRKIVKADGAIKFEPDMAILAELISEQSVEEVKAFYLYLSQFQVEKSKEELCMVNS